MSIDYTQGSDSGDAVSASISPVINGEIVNQTVINRPTENLRARTDLIKTHIDNVESVQRIDRGLTLISTGLVTWNGPWNGAPGAPAQGVVNSGALQLEAGTEITLRPITAPGITNFASLVSGDYTFTSNQKYDFMGGNEIEIEIINSGNVVGDLAVVTMEGGEIVFDDYDGVAKLQNRIVVDISATTTQQTVKDEIEADAVAGLLVTVDVATPAGLATLVTQANLSGGVDAELHELSAAVLTTFFNTEVNRLQTGDSLCIYFASDLERRQSILEEALTTVTAGMLFNSRQEPEKLAYALPLFVVPKDVTDFGILFGGTKCVNMTETNIGASAAELEADLLSAVVPTGASIVGAAALAGTPTSLTTGTVESQIAALLAAINLRLVKNGTSGNTITGDVIVNAPGQILAGTTGRNIGSSTARFNGYFENLNLYAPLLPGAGGTATIGDAGNRLDVFAADLSADTLTLSGGALTLASEHFTGGVQNPLISSATAVPDSDKILLLEANPAASDGLRVYFDVVTKALDITINAKWDGPGQEWNKGTGGNFPSRLNLSANNFTYNTRDAINAWSDNNTSVGWTTPRIDVNTVNEILKAPMAIGEWKYSTPKTRKYNLPLSLAIFPSDGLWGFVHAWNGSVLGWSTPLYLQKSGAGATQVIWPLNLPHNAVFTNIELYNSGTYAEDVEWGVYRSTHDLNGVVNLTPTATVSLLSTNEELITTGNGTVEIAQPVGLASAAIRTIDNNTYNYFVWSQVAAATSRKYLKILITYTQTEVNVG